MPGLIRRSAAGLSLAALVAIAACSTPAPRQVAAFRPQGAEIWSSAAFDPARIQGEWTQAASFAASPKAACAPGSLRIGKASGGALALQGSLCLNGQTVPVSGVARPVGPGRLAVPGMKDWWVIWVDSGYRTLAVGTPGGEFGFVLDRGRIPGDRLTAAREIFDFNSYRKDLLRSF